MQLFHVIAILLTLTALFSYVNHRYIHLHATVGVMLIGLVLSLGLVALGEMGFGVKAAATQFLQNVNFGDALLHWMLGFLLFAGALTVDLTELHRQRGVTLLLASGGTILATAIVGGLSFLVFRAVGIGLPLLQCMIFGALISPTDPVAVVGLMRRVGAPKEIETVIAGESLFNDGVGVVVFLGLLGLSRSDHPVTASGAGLLFTRQAIGGIVLGFLTGWSTTRLLNQVVNYQVEVLLTLAVVMGTYAAADGLAFSGPLAVVMAGLLIGNRGGAFETAEDVIDDLNRFWELVDELLNAVLFVLIGLEVLVLVFTRQLLLAAAMLVPAVLLSRLVSVAAMLGLLSMRRKFPVGLVSILTWGGLRGGLAVAMAISLPPGIARDRIVAVTYGVVVFSILVQGTTMRGLVNRFLR